MEIVLGSTPQAASAWVAPTRAYLRAGLALELGRGDPQCPAQPHQSIPSVVESLLDAAKALIRIRSAHAMQDFRRAVRPVYAVEDCGPNRRLKHAGTGVLLMIDVHPVLVTAAHVLDPLRQGVELSVGGPPGTHPVPIEGGVIRMTRPPQGSRLKDHVDSAFWKMPDNAVRALGNVWFVDPFRLSHNRAPVERRCYMAMGFAQSRNRKSIDNAHRSISNLISRYSGSVIEIPALAAELGASGADHMFLNFEKRAQAEDDTTIDAFTPTGLSGGPLLDLGDFVSESAYSTETTHRASLSGILIEYHSRHKAVVAVKIGPIVAGIKKSLQA